MRIELGLKKRINNKKKKKKKRIKKYASKF